jgi:sarcosine oxidase delta subunit
MDDADIMEAALRSVSFDPDSIDTVRIRELANFNPSISRDPDIGVALRGFANQDIPAPSATSFEDMAQDMDQSVRNYNWMRSNRAGGMKNQWRGDVGGRAIRDAAQEGIDRAAAATQAERMATAAAILGAAGMGGMMSDTIGRFQGDDASVANAPAPDMPMESDPLMDFVAPDVDMLPVDDMPIPEERFAPVTLSDADMGLTDFSPMDTADLVAEQRPIPASTPAVAMELPAPK